MKGNCTNFYCFDGAEWPQICNNTKVSPPTLERETVEAEPILDCKGEEGCGDILGQSLGTLKFNSDLEVEFRTNPDASDENTTNQQLIQRNLRECCATFYRVCYPNSKDSGFVIYGQVKSYTPGEASPDNDVIGTAVITPVEDPNGKMHFYEMNDVKDWMPDVDFDLPYKGH